MWKMQKKAAAFLSQSDAVRRVYYPGLPEAQGYEINRKQAKNGGAMLSFELKEDYDIRTFLPLCNWWHWQRVWAV